jgi:dTMP kinase
VIFLSLSSEISALRGGYGQERYEKEEMQRNVLEVFTQLQQDPRDVEDWKVVDASGDIEQVSARIWDILEPILENANKGKIKTVL